VRDRTGRVRCRSLTLTHLLVICFFYSAGIRHGQRRSVAANHAHRRHKPDGLLVAVSSESADLFHALTSPCLLCVWSANITRILQSTFSGVSGGLLRKSPKKDERKESDVGKQKVRLTLNASTTFSGVSGGFYAKAQKKMEEKKAMSAHRIVTSN